MWELDYKESWMPKNWCFWTVVLEKSLESPLDCKELQPVYPKGDRSWVFIGKTDVEAETPILWPPDAKSWIIGKDPDAGKDWKQEEKGMTEDEMVGWHHRLDGYGFGWTLGVGDGQGSLAFFRSWGHRVGHNWVTELNWLGILFLNFLIYKISYHCLPWVFNWNFQIYLACSHLYFLPNVVSSIQECSHSLFFLSQVKSSSSLFFIITHFQLLPLPRKNTVISSVFYSSLSIFSKHSDS